MANTAQSISVLDKRDTNTRRLLGAVGVAAAVSHMRLGWRAPIKSAGGGIGQCDFVFGIRSCPRNILRMAAYVIQAGDTPLGIARKFGMSFDQFKAVNPGLCAAK
jgi:hypothetical protein